MTANGGIAAATADITTAAVVDTSHTQLQAMTINVTQDPIMIR